MRSVKKRLRSMGLLTGILIVAAAPASPARAQEVTTEKLINQLAGLETAADLDVVALRQQALDRVKSKADATPLKRPPIAGQLLKLPQFAIDVQFDPDTSIVRPESYKTVGRIADVLTDPSLLSYVFLIVGHTDASGRRDNNLTLSQRRADSIRDVLVTTFKVSPKRLKAIGLGEEQLLDAAHPTAPVNQQVQVVTVGKVL
jgi:outer membrane protein OmpA-like peptidoglycan-associated protein